MTLTRQSKDVDVRSGGHVAQSGELASGKMEHKVTFLQNREITYGQHAKSEIFCELTHV